MELLLKEPQHKASVYSFYTAVSTLTRPTQVLIRPGAPPSCSQILVFCALIDLSLCPPSRATRHTSIRMVAEQVETVVGADALLEDLEGSEHVRHRAVLRRLRVSPVTLHPPLNCPYTVPLRLQPAGGLSKAALKRAKKKAAAAAAAAGDTDHTSIDAAEHTGVAVDLSVSAASLTPADAAEEEGSGDDEADSGAPDAPGATAAKKKKKKKSKKKKAGEGPAEEAAAVPTCQTDPPSVPVRLLFPGGVFPEGERQSYTEE